MTELTKVDEQSRDARDQAEVTESGRDEESRRAKKTAFMEQLNSLETRGSNQVCMFARSVKTMMDGKHVFATSGGAAWRRQQRRLRPFRRFVHWATNMELAAATRRADVAPAKLPVLVIVLLPPRPLPRLRLRPTQRQLLWSNTLLQLLPHVVHIPHQ